MASSTTKKARFVEAEVYNEKAMHVNLSRRLSAFFCDVRVGTGPTSPPHQFPKAILDQHSPSWDKLALLLALHKYILYLYFNREKPHKTRRNARGK